MKVKRDDHFRRPASGFRLVLFLNWKQVNKSARGVMPARRDSFAFGPRRLGHYERLPAAASHLRQDRLPIATNTKVNTKERSRIKKV